MDEPMKLRIFLTTFSKMKINTKKCVVPRYRSEKILPMIYNQFPDHIHCMKKVLIRSFSGLYFPAFELNTERSLHIQSECGKIRTRKTPNTHTFHAEIKINQLIYLPFSQPISVWMKYWSCINWLIFWSTEELRKKDLMSFTSLESMSGVSLQFSWKLWKIE